MTRWSRTVFGFVLGRFLRLYLATLRVHVAVDPALDPREGSPWILCFWHGEQVPLLCWPRRRATVALVSHSADGQLQSQILGALGLRIERGSSSRGGARGLVGIIRRLARQHDAAFAVDGPKGPRHTVAPGARLAAERSSGRLVPMGSHAPSAVTFTRSWDQFALPRPWSHVYVRLGAPLSSSVTADELARAIARSSELARDDAHMLPSRRHALLRHAGRA